MQQCNQVVVTRAVRTTSTTVPQLAAAPPAEIIIISPARRQRRKWNPLQRRLLQSDMIFLILDGFPAQSASPHPPSKAACHLQNSECLIRFRLKAVLVRRLQPSLGSLGSVEGVATMGWYWPQRLRASLVVVEFMQRGR